MNDVFNYLSQFHASSPLLKEFLEKTLRPRSYEKYAILLQEGEVCNKVWYLKKWLVGCFYYRNEYEVTTWFMNEGHAILAAKSFFEQRKSKYYIEALEPCDVYYIEYANVSYAFEHFPESVVIRTRVTDFYSNLTDLRVRDFLHDIYGFRITMNSENQNTEWKESWRDEYLKWICGFANAQGCKIFIGLDNKGNITGLGDYQKLLKDIPNKMRDTRRGCPRQ